MLWLLSDSSKQTLVYAKSLFFTPSLTSSLLAILSSVFIAIRTRLMSQALTFMFLILVFFLLFFFPDFVHLGLYWYAQPLKQLRPSHCFTSLFLRSLRFTLSTIYKFPFSNTFSASLTTASFPANTQERSFLAFKNSNCVLISLCVLLWLDMKTILQIFNNLSTQINFQHSRQVYFIK